MIGWILVLGLLFPGLGFADVGAVKDLTELLFKGNGPESIQTDSIVVMVRGRVVFERYARGYTDQMPHLCWSISKSITNLIVGAAVEKKMLRPEESICRDGVQLSPGTNCALTPAAFMDWASGLHWNEVYERDESRTKSSVGQMLFGDGSGDMVSFVLSHPSLHPPETFFHYSTGDATVLLSLLRVPAAARNDVPWSLLFDPLGMDHVTFEQDGAGNFIGGSYVYMTPRNLLKIGELILADGRWGGRRLLPKGWIAHFTAANPFDESDDDEAKFIPARSFWRLRVPEEGEFANLPTDTIVARGHAGQFLIVIPSLKVVAVRFGEDAETGPTTAVDIYRFMKDLTQLAKASR